ncbi:MAG TPA: hypothetical protein VGQ42_13415 [Candidatus Dormibacteraeota bacterium]|jgi:hypothetical protein|nr:hypothetical protein [Candidatus Dormibacteraeota bacterium]
MTVSPLASDVCTMVVDASVDKAIANLGDHVPVAWLDASETGYLSGNGKRLRVTVPGNANELSTSSTG